MRAPRYLILSGLLILLLQMLAFSAYWTYKHDEKTYQLSLLPDALGVSQVLYRKEQSRGFGPGGNETGFIVYALPRSTASAASIGQSFFDNLPANLLDHQRGGRGDFSNWQSTPISASPQWPEQAPNTRLRTRDYLCRYGFCIDVDPALLGQVDGLINNPGSYYAYGRIGMIIVSPTQRLVVYLYNG